MKLIALLGVALSITVLPSCESVPSPKTKPEIQQRSTDQLPPQTLKAGDCGLFLWTLDTKKRLVFFQKQGESTAKIMDKSKTINLQKISATQDIGVGDDIGISYSAVGYDSVMLSGKFTEALQDGQRVRATLKSVKPDGWQAIMPLAGVYVCE